MKKVIEILFITFFAVISLASSIFPLQVKKESYISSVKEPGAFILSESGKSAPLLVSSKDYPGVIRVLKNLKEDIGKVTGVEPLISIDTIPRSKEIVLAGTIGRSDLIDKLISENKLDAAGVVGKWETFIIQVIEKPYKNIDRALIIAGSDKRGTIFGIYDCSEKIGVSPWYWWADVPVKKQPALYVLPGRYSMGEPKVKYRGIFINDEAPAMSGWSIEKYGTDMFNHQLYEHMFDLILRLKGNFLWPAMWGRAFYDDDSLNPKLADEYGIVIGTSHHEPMMRAHVEWQRYGEGPWNYEKNPANLQAFWRKGIERMGNNESIVTLAMRGDGDEAMSPTANVALLEKIVQDQRKIIADLTGKDVTRIPQVWALYKEVEEYYDKGMRVPDDVTVLLCDDNWGNIRKLPALTEEPRNGGYGIYYHFDYVGGPRNYKWLNTNQVEKVWEQMHLAYEYNARQIWIVNVGDLKPMEFPINFFLDYAWNPSEWTAENLPEYYRLWSEQQFGKEHAEEIADIISKYTKYNSRRKPEMLSPETYSLVNYLEFESVVNDYNKLKDQAQKIYDSIPKEYRDAFYELVIHPVSACANLNDLYFIAGKNHLYAKQGRASTNILAEKVRKLFHKDAEITDYYNNTLAGGKWKHMMDQTHIGYTTWQEPGKNIMPEAEEIELPNEADMGVAVEGSEKWWPEEKSNALLPEFNAYDQKPHYFEIFNRGKAPFEYSISSGKPWIKISKEKGKIETEERVWINVNWTKAEHGKMNIPLTINGAGKKVIVTAVVINPLIPKRDQVEGFVESDGYISIEAEHFTRIYNSGSFKWIKIPNLGRTGSSMTTIPVTANIQAPEINNPHLEYKVCLFSKGEIKINAFFSPSLNFGGNGKRYAVAIDDERPRVINIHEADTIPDWEYPQWWNETVSNNIKIKTTTHSVIEAGEHILKFWALDPGIVLEKIVIGTGEPKMSYLGPPESYIGKIDKKKF
ncbi:MAG TPA: glycosyl hydrolase 115 family protein [Ignavibacteriaceae bacterium]|nr:glycosyl hydrolase 115 family protein [Ignavibacteriaceae bacterium]